MRNPHQSNTSWPQGLPIVPPRRLAIGPLRRQLTGSPRRLAAVLFLPLLLVAAGCSAGAGQDGAAPASGDAVAVDAPDAEATDSAAVESASEPESPASTDAGETGNSVSELAELITELPAAPTGLPEPAPEQPRPVAMSIDALGVSQAAIIDVGVEENGDMEIPPADQVGWYQYGPSPGQPGSAVLAAHIAYDGQDGVFVQLDRLEIGSTITVGYEDGSVVEFASVSKEQYDKDDLPKESIFDRSGPARLVLITCGGEFNRSLRSYEDNVVVYAEAVEAGSDQT